VPLVCFFSPLEIRRSLLLYALAGPGRHHVCCCESTPPLSAPTSPRHPPSPSNPPTEPLDHTDVDAFFPCSLVPWTFAVFTASACAKSERPVQLLFFLTPVVLRVTQLLAPSSSVHYRCPPLAMSPFCPVRVRFSSLIYVARDLIDLGPLARISDYMCISSFSTARLSSSRLRCAGLWVNALILHVYNNLLVPSAICPLSGLPKCLEGALPLYFPHSKLQSGPTPDLCLISLSSGNTYVLSFSPCPSTLFPWAAIPRADSYHSCFFWAYLN